MKQRANPPTTIPAGPPDDDDPEPSGAAATTATPNAQRENTRCQSTGPNGPNRVREYEHRRGHLRAGVARAPPTSARCGTTRSRA